MTKAPWEIACIRESGRILAEVFKAVGPRVQPGVTTFELDAFVEAEITRHGARPSFKDYKVGPRIYPFSVCASVNDVVVHGFPNHRPLMDGDLVTLDIGVWQNGYHADRATSFAVGSLAPETQKLMETTRACLEAAIRAARPGNRLGDIGHAVSSTAEGYHIIKGFGGHGVGRQLHEDPFVPNEGYPGQGLPLEPGMVLAIEPMVSMRTPLTQTLEDGWSVATADGSISAHFEHTIHVTEGAPEVLTRPR